MGVNDTYVIGCAAYACATILTAAILYAMERCRRKGTGWWSPRRGPEPSLLRCCGAAVLWPVVWAIAVIVCCGSLVVAALDALFGAD